MIRPKVLVLAEMANPDWISVPLVGWKHIQAIDTFADSIVVTHERNRAGFEGAGFPADRVCFVPAGAMERTIYAIADRIGGTGAMGGVTQTAFGVPMYYAFERYVWQKYGDRLRQGEFDLVHRVTPVSPGVPSPIAQHCARIGRPFILGPINGGVPWPKGFEEERRKEGEWGRAHV